MADANAELYNASITGDVAAVKRILSSGKYVDINKRGDKGWHPLLCASVKGHFEVAKVLVEHGADVNLTAAGTHGPGHTAMMGAAGWGHLEIIKLLLKSGVNVHQVNGSGQTMLDRAKEGRRTHCYPTIEAAMKGGAPTGVTVDEELQEAAKAGDLVNVKRLLGMKPGPDINKRSPPNGWTPLLAASVRGHVEVAAFLIDHGADVNASANGQKTGHNSLLAAAGWGHTKVVKLLVQKGADVTRVNTQGQSALDRAKAANRKESVQFLEGVMVTLGMLDAAPAPAKPPAPAKTPAPAETPAPAGTPAPSAPTAGTADPSVDDGYHVMLSYQWDDQETVKKICAALKAAGLRVWMDIEQMSGSTNEAMAEAVESASVVLVCMSNKYKESKNCRKEAEYADLGNVPLIPLKMEKGYRPKGWLGLIIGSKLFYDFSGKYPFEEKLNELVSEIKKLKRTDE